MTVHAYIKTVLVLSRSMDKLLLTHTQQPLGLKPFMAKLAFGKPLLKYLSTIGPDNFIFLVLVPKWGCKWEQEAMFVHLNHN